MNITSQTMENIIKMNMRGVEEDPHLKKLLEELNSLKSEIYGDKVERKTGTETTINTAQNNVIAKTYTKKKKKRNDDDSTFRASINMFAERRKSDRISGKPPKHFIYDIDEVENQTLFSNGQLRKSKEFMKRRPFISRHSNTGDRVILDPEQITLEMLNNICFNMNDKIYDQVNGSSCHQCRQKTRDTKTICRNLDCFGVRGQFCGPCAKNRYGVDIKDALLDPYWSCFVCQDVCNCSFCRSRKGKRPTGILAPMAKREGHDSVKNFLDKLKVKLSEEDDYAEYMLDPESVLGFIGQDTICTVEGNAKIFNGDGSDLTAPIMWDIIDTIENNVCFRGFEQNSISNSKLKNLNAIIDSLSTNII